MARSETNELNRFVSAAIELIVQKDRDTYDYLSEHYAFGETEDKATEYIEDLAVTMLATTLCIEFDSETEWEKRKHIHKKSGKIFKTKNIYQSAEGNKDGLWTSVIAATIFILQHELEENPPLKIKQILFYL